MTVSRSPLETLNIPTHVAKLLSPLLVGLTQSIALAALSIAVELDITVFSVEAQQHFLWDLALSAVMACHS